MSTGGAFKVYVQHHQAAAASTGWKSPVPYLFGGLAAMLGLIAFALLILACSYWKLDPATGDQGSSDIAGDGKEDSCESVFMNSILVIMPGDEKPTRLATPAVTSRDDQGIFLPKEKAVGLGEDDHDTKS